jgi:DNA-binding transcriptional LysR family regulator
MKNAPWDLYQIFVAVARHSGLTGAASTLALSPATIGRRMLELEDMLATALFVRSQAGYALTPEGQSLFEHLRDMESAARKVDGWRMEKQQAVTIRIAAGTWMVKLLCDNIAALCAETDPFRLDFSISEQRARLAYREADIGIRAFAPEEGNLATRRLSDSAYAVYRSRVSRPAADRWVAVNRDEAVSTYLRWPHDNHPDDIVFTVNRPTALRDLLVAGAGIGLLPCMIGDRDPQLERVGECIRELQHGQWLLVNNADRHRREIRTVTERMARLLKGYAPLMTGKLGGM